MTIPKIIHHIWVGPNPIPVNSEGFIDHIKELHPDFEHRLWTDNDITPENFTNYNFINNTNSYAQKADIMRYEILYRYGGIYLDTDFDIFKNLSSLLTNDLIVCNEDNNIDKYMSIGFIACNQYNPQLLNCVKCISTVDFNLPINLATGPAYFRRCINLSDKITIIPTEYMYPLPYKGTDFTKNENTYGVHWWHKNW